jgi:anaerobic magnesium-protoporphyrin IX monomethyl ester cyclase
MKILLIRPPIYSKTLEYPSGPRFGVPVGLLYLAAYLEKQGWDVSIYDALVDFAWEDVVPDEEGRYHIGTRWPDLVEKVLGFRPDIVGITNPFSDMADYTIRVASEIKAVRPGITTIVGGPHATSCPEDFLRDHGSVDYVVRGEGEITLAELTRILAEGGEPKDIPGISYRDGDTIRSNPAAPFIQDLDGLPLPAYHMVPMERYFELAGDGYPSRFMFEYPGSEREVSIITSRGCPFHCVFCGNHIHMGRQWRYHGVPYILRHMELLVSRYGVRHFHLEDDNIGLKIGRFEELLDGLMAKGWDITWDTSNGIRLDGLTPEILRKMKASGCTYLEFGIDSGKQETLDRIIKKGVKLDYAESIVGACKQLGIDCHTLYVVGFPGESRDGIEETFRFAKHMLWRYDAIPHLCMARPLPGTELYEICEKNGYLTEPVLPALGNGLHGEIFPRIMIRTEVFGPQELGRWVGKFNRDVVVITLFKTLLWLCRHPGVIPTVLRKFRHDRRRGLGEAVKRAFYGGLFFKYNYLDRDLRQSFARLHKQETGGTDLESSTG